MTNATKTLAVILGVLSAVTAAVSWSSGPAASHAFQSNLIQIDSAAVDRLVIDKPREPAITLAKRNQIWKVSGEKEESYPADAESVERALEQLNRLSVNAVATRKPENFTRYKVDSTGIQVSLYSGEELLNRLYVGAPQFESRRSFNNYVRLGSQNTVYSVEGFLRPSFAKKLGDWRDKTVWDLERSGIERIDFIYPADSSFSITRAGANQWVSQGDTLSRTSVSTIISRMENLRAAGFADSLSVKTFGAGQYALQLQVSEGKQRRIRLKVSPTDSTRFVGVATGFPYVFTLRKDSWKDNVLKSRTELLKNPG